MYLVIRGASGIRVDGVVLTLGGDSMRVALRGNPDVVEFRRSYADWFNDQGNSIEFEALVDDGRAAALHAEMLPLAAIGRA